MKPFVWKSLCSIKRFFWFYIQRKFTSVRLYQSYVAQISVHACIWSAIMTHISSFETAFLFLDRLRSIVSKSSDEDFWIRLIWGVFECFATCHSSEEIWPLNAAATCLTAVFVTCWSSSISEKVVTPAKSKKNRETTVKKTNITNEGLWVKITLYASKSTVDSVR